MSVLSDLWERLRTVVLRRREDREMDEELRFHLDMEAEQNRRAGMSADEARRHSRIALGGIERTKEDVRDARGTRLWFDGAGDLRYALRSLAHARGFATTAILTLALGVGATTAVFSAVDAVLLEPLPYAQPGRLVRLYSTDVRHPSQSSVGFVVSPVYAKAYVDQMSAFAAVGVFNFYAPAGADIGTGADAHRVSLLPVTAGYFDALDVHPAMGHGFSRADETGAPLVVVSHALWERELHGDPDVVGSSLTMNGTPYTVIGVMGAGFADPSGALPDAWVPLDMRPASDAHNADNHYLSVIARLRPGVTLGAAQAELDGLDRQLGRQYPDAEWVGGRLYPLKDDVVRSSSLALRLMLGAVGLVLLLVCVNVANLMLVRGADRAHEFALRSALGADRGRLIRQMLIESGTLALAGGVGGVVVARVVMAAIVAVAAGSIPRLESLSLEPRLLGFLFAVSAASALGFGLAPALRAGRVDPRDALSEQGRGTTGGLGRMRARQWLVTTQITLAFVLLVGAGLLIASVQRIRDINLGVPVNGALVFALNLPSARYDSTARAQLYEEFARRAATIPGVTAVGGVSKLPATGPFNQWGTQVLTGRLVGTREGSAGTENRVVSGDYFAAAGIPVIEGRVFDARDDAQAPNRVVISKNLAQRLFPGERAVGQRLETGGWKSEIIGVVGDVAVDAEGTEDYYVYHAHRQVAGDRTWALAQVIRSTRPLAQIEPEVHRVLAQMDPQLVMYQPMSLAEAIGRGEAQRVFVLRLLAAFALTALALAGLGLFGVLAYGVRTRAREFGIRMALGAPARGITRLVLGEGLRLTAVGLALGFIVAAGVGRMMEALLFHVRPLDPAVLAGAATFMVGVAGVAAYLPARRATGADPMAALREE